MALPSLTRDPISLELDGTIYTGTFTAYRKTITVWHAGRNRMAHLPSSSPPEVLARILLEELVLERRDKL